jgi:hypothetical protein
MAHSMPRESAALRRTNHAGRFLPGPAVSHREPFLHADPGPHDFVAYTTSPVNADGSVRARTRQRKLVSAGSGHLTGKRIHPAERGITEHALARMCDSAPRPNSRRDESRMNVMTER